MSKAIGVLVIGLLAAGIATAEPSSLRGKYQPKRLALAEVMALVKGQQAVGAWCDSFGFQWDLAGAGMSGGAIAITGAANMCGSSPVSGTLALSRGLPLDVTASVTPGCYCNEFHSMQATYNRSSGVFEGMAYATGSCVAEAPVTLGRC